MASTYTDQHRLDAELARCVCGGEWVWFEPENVEGCEVAGPPPCGVCGEPLAGELGEFWNPASPDAPSVLAHADCGLARGLEVA